MTAEADAGYERMLGRVAKILIALGVVGTVGFTVARGWRYGAGFLLGAAISWGSLWRWQKVVNALGVNQKRRSSWRLVLRLLVLGAAAYVIVRYLEVNVLAALVGLLASAAAVVIEILYELFTTRT